MSEYNPVSEDLNESGLMDFLSIPFYYTYRRLLDEMAKLADQDGGRKFSATHIQLTDRIWKGRRPEQNTHIKNIASMVDEMIRVGLVETVPGESRNRYQFPTRQRLNEIATKLEKREIFLSPSRAPFQRR